MNDNPTGQWRVVACKGNANKRTIVDSTYVQADDKDKAAEIGRAVLQRRVRGRFTVEAFVYEAWKDWRFSGWLKRMDD